MKAIGNLVKGALDVVGLGPKETVVNNYGSTTADSAVADAQVAANNLVKNKAVNLATDNIATVNPGGTTTDTSAIGVDTAKRRRPTTGLSSSLGITV